MITHDLGVVAEVADDLLVMYGGRVVERGSSERVFTQPQHPYTWGLLGSMPRLDRERSSFFFSSRSRHTSLTCDWSSDVCSSDLSGRARVRVINAAPPAPVLDVRGPGGSPFSTGLPLAQVSGYRTVDAGTLPLSAGPPGGMGTDLAVPVGANQVISVVLVSEGQRIAAQPHVDAAGPTTVPPGSIAAGYGGGADRHGPLSELLLGGVAVAAGLASVVLSQRGRRSMGRAW